MDKEKIVEIMRKEKFVLTLITRNLGLIFTTKDSNKLLRFAADDYFDELMCSGVIESHQSLFMNLYMAEVALFIVELDSIELKKS